MNSESIQFSRRLEHDNKYMGCLTQPGSYDTEVKLIGEKSSDVFRKKCYCQFHYFKGYSDYDIKTKYGRHHLRHGKVVIRPQGRLSAYDPSLIFNYYRSDWLERDYIYFPVHAQFLPDGPSSTFYLSQLDWATFIRGYPENWSKEDDDKNLQLYISGEDVFIRQFYFIIMCQDCFDIISDKCGYNLSFVKGTLDETPRKI